MLKNFMVVSILLVCTCAYADAPENKEKTELVENLGYTYAMFVNGKVEFYLPQNIEFDWQKYAPQKIKSINVNELTKEDIAFIRTGEQFLSSIYLKYSLPIPVELKGRHFYLISSKGVDELTPSGLTGRAKFSMFEGGKISPEQIQYFGGVIADSKTIGKSDEGGFVMSSSSNLKITVFSDEAKIKKVFSVQTSGRNIDHIFTFRIAGIDSEYLFINWHPDDKCPFSCCGNGYSLFQVDKGLRELTSTTLGCDV